MQDLYISMLGAQGTGKSSLLASMYYTFKQTAGDLGFIMKPDNEDDSKNLEKTHTQLQAHLQGIRGGSGGLKASEESSEYSLNLGFHHNGIKDHWLNLHFWDFPGGWIDDNRESVINQLKKSQVIIIAIDTPALVVDDEHGNPGYWNNKVNRPKAIADLLDEVDFNEPKLILMVPIKCEAWMTSKVGINLITDSVKKGYKDVISSLSKYTYTTVAITPVQTLGNYLWKLRKHPNDSEFVKDVFRPMNPDVNGRSEFAPLHVEQPLFYTLSFISEIAHNSLDKKINRRKGNHGSRNLFHMLFDSLTGASAQWEEAQKNLINKLSELKTPLRKLNNKRKESHDEGFVVLHGNMLLEKEN